MSESKTKKRIKGNDYKKKQNMKGQSYRLLPSGKGQQGMIYEGKNGCRYVVNSNGSMMKLGGNNE